MIIIDKVKPEEILKVKDLLSLTWKDTYGKNYSQEAIEKITSSWHDPKLLTAQAANPDIYFAAAKEDGKITGVITVRKVDENTARLNRLYIHPGHQGKGIGSKLMSSSLEYFSGVKKLQAQCEKKNGNACAFYLKKGFKIVGERDETIEGTKVQTVEFEKKLDANIDKTI